MLDVRMHGRGGQGVVRAADMLALAAFLDGYHVRSFPIYGVERRGAPVTASLRIDQRPIRCKSPLSQPHCVVVLDSKLMHVVNVLEGLRHGGEIILNNPLPPHELGLNINAKRIATIDANAIALEILGKPITNTVILGAFSRAVGLVSMDALIEAIKRSFGEGPLAMKNVKAAQKAFEETKVEEFEVIQEGEEIADDRFYHPLFPSPIKIPVSHMIREYGTQKTGFWRVEKPVINLERCTGCGLCIEYCPDLVILSRPDGPEIDYDFCKGCGICAQICSHGAIEMISEY